MKDQILSAIKLKGFKTIKRKHVEKLTLFYNELHKIQEILDDNIKTAQDRHGEDKIELEREGKKVAIAQKHLWQEIQYLGRYGHQAAEVMKNKYPFIWDIFADEEKQTTKIKKFEMLVFGFDHKNITLPNYISLTEKLIKLNLKECKPKTLQFKKHLLKLISKISK